MTIEKVIFLCDCFLQTYVIASNQKREQREVGKFHGECGDTWATHCKALFVLVLLLVEGTTGVLLPLRHFTHWGGTEISAFQPFFFFLYFFFED